MNGYVDNENSQRGRYRCKGIMGPAIMIAVGVLFLLDNLGPEWANFNHTWPLILLVIGVVKIIQSSAPAEPNLPYVATPPPPPVNTDVPPANEGMHG